MKKVFLNTLTLEEIISRLKNGEVVKCKKEKYIIKMIDGVIVWIEDEDMIIGDSMVINKENDYYFEEKDELKIEVGKFYKTRGGRKVFVSSVGDSIFGITEGDRCVKCWFLNGSWLKTESSEYDLIAEWEDEE